MDLLQKVSEELRRLRKEKGFNNPESFCEAHRIDLITYKGVERAKYDPEIRELKEIVRVHGMGLREFFLRIHENRVTEDP